MQSFLNFTFFLSIADISGLNQMVQLLKITHDGLAMRSNMPPAGVHCDTGKISCFLKEIPCMHMFLTYYFP